MWIIKSYTPDFVLLSASNHEYEAVPELPVTNINSFVNPDFNVGRVTILPVTTALDIG
jgi:hypothetical protein